MVLRKNMHQLEDIITFIAQMNSKKLQDSWCDDIELFIDYDIIELDDKN